MKLRMPTAIATHSAEVMTAMRSAATRQSNRSGKPGGLAVADSRLASILASLTYRPFPRTGLSG